MLMGANPSRRRNQAGMAIAGGAVGGATAAIVGHQLRKRLRNSIRMNPSPGLRVYLLPKSDSAARWFDYIVQRGNQSVAHEFGNRALTSEKAALDQARRRFPGIKRGKSKNPRWVKTPGGRSVGLLVETQGGPGARRYLLDIPGTGRVWTRTGRVYDVDPRQHLNADQIAAVESRNQRNPADAAGMYETFQGKPATGATEVREPAEPDAELAQLGDLRGLLTHLKGYGDLKLKFTHADGVKLAANSGGTQLHIIGGDQGIDLAGLPVDAAKRHVDLGEAREITYRAAKVHTDFQATDWVHEFGEEGGARPRLIYDRERQRLKLAGGDYHVDAPGIIN